MQIREALVMAIAEIQLILADSQPFGNYTSFFFHLGGPSQKRLFFLIFDRSPNLNECADDLRDCAELKPYSLAITRRIDEVQRSFPKISVDSQSGSFLRVVFLRRRGLYYSLLASIQVQVQFPIFIRA